MTSLFEINPQEIMPSIRAVIMCLFFYMLVYYATLIVGSFGDFNEVKFKPGISLNINREYF